MIPRTFPTVSALSARMRMISRPVRIGASGLRSSWASTARNSLRLRFDLATSSNRLRWFASASRSAASVRLKASMFMTTETWPLGVPSLAASGTAATWVQISLPSSLV